MFWLTLQWIDQYQKESRWVGLRIDWNDWNQNMPRWKWIWLSMKNEQWKNENGLKLIQIENVEGNWPAGLISTIGVCCVQNEKLNEKLNNNKKT